MFKIILLGNSSVGKTSIVNRFVGDRFESDYTATVGPEFQAKIMNIRGNEIRLHVWDLVGMDTSYNCLNRNFCREANGVIMVGDITSVQSIEDTANWKQEVDDIVATAGAPIPIVLCINKVDKLQGVDESKLEYIQTEDGVQDFAKEHQFIAAYRVSAKEDIEIATAFSTLVREMLIQEINEQLEHEAAEGNYDVNVARAASFNLRAGGRS